MSAYYHAHTARIKKRLFKSLYLSILFLISFCVFNTAHAFDHRYVQWTRILQNYVYMDVENPSQSWVDYQALQLNPTPLVLYLAKISAISREEYQSWTEDQQLAFLINAYNAFTIYFVLTKYPDVNTIDDLGGFFTHPWDKKSVFLWGDKLSLNELRNKYIRNFKTAKAIFSLSDATVSSPMLLNLAYDSIILDLQLEQAMCLFLSDHQRNYFDSDTNTLYLSKIFDWYASDFSKGYHHFTSLKTALSFYTKELSTELTAQLKLQQGAYRMKYSNYDTHLNDKKTLSNE